MLDTVKPAFLWTRYTQKANKTQLKLIDDEWD